MPPGRFPLRSLAVASAIVLLALTAPTPHRTSETGAIIPSSHVAALAITPPSWWMRSGDRTEFAALWSEPGCTLTPTWFRWSLADGSESGVLGSTGGSDVNFTGRAVMTERSTLEVRSAAVAQCGVVRSIAVATSTSNITVVAPLAVANLTVTPNPVSPGQVVYLRGTVAGGAPPYQEQVSWGDGTRSTSALDAGGSFALAHAFPVGKFTPTIWVNDSSGQVVSSAIDEPLSASTGLAAAIDAPDPEVDVGVELPLVASVEHTDGPVAVGWACGPSSAQAVRDSQDQIARFSCTFASIGEGRVFFEAIPQAPNPPANATLLETVVSPPTLTIVAPNGTAEAGIPCALDFHVSGGVPPFQLDWELSGSGLGGVLSLPTDGWDGLSVSSPISGDLSVVARLVDSDGVTSSISSAALVVGSELNASVSFRSSANGTGTLVSLAASVTSGLSPISWVVLGPGEGGNASSDSGVLTALGPIEWSSFCPIEGTVVFSFFLVDAAGAFRIDDGSVVGVARLFGNVTISSPGGDAPGSIELSVSFDGGAAPYRLWVVGSDGDSWNRTLASSGRTVWWLTPSRAGSLTLRIGLNDSLGGHLEWVRVTDVSVLPSGPVPSSATLDDLAAAGFAIGGIVVFLALRYSRRASASRISAPRPDPRKVLWEIVSPSDGAERGTVELLAEEAGVPLAEVRSTLDRLIVEGTVRSEVEEDGSEILAWELGKAP